MFKGEINFDRFIRGLIFVASIVALCYVINYLSAVLVPFFVGAGLPAVSDSRLFPAHVPPALPPAQYRAYARAGGGNNSGAALYGRAGDDK